jgi:hypothetical protein
MIANFIKPDMVGRDLRRYARQTNVRLFIGFFLILFLLGDGLIWHFYGLAPALFGLLCLVGGTAPLILIALILWGMDLIVKRARDE